jgi:hypothetical protein
MVDLGRLSFGQAYLYVETAALFTRRLNIIILRSTGVATCVAGNVGGWLLAALLD